MNPAGGAKDDPIIVQLGPDPVFKSRDDTNVDLKCNECGSLLIEKYFSASFLGIKIRCFRCGSVTSTPSYQNDGDFPGRVIMLDENREFGIDTVEYPPSAVFASSSQADKIHARWSPKTEVLNPFDFSEKGLQNVQELYEKYTGLRLDQLIRSLDKHHATGRSGSKKMPFTWAIWKIRACFKAGRIDFDDYEANAALSRIHAFGHVVEAWKHHPYFEKIISEIKADKNVTAFFHTIGQFICASYLFSHGNWVNFSISSKKGERKPDLYGWYRPGEKIFVEVKSSPILVWDPDKMPSLGEIRRKITSLITSNRQIGRSRPGAIVIVNNHPNESIQNWVYSEISSCLQQHGRSVPHLAAVMSMWSPGVRRLLPDDGATQGTMQLPYEFYPLPNPHCTIKETIFRTEP